jgi:hypothetical protein
MTVVRYNFNAFETGEEYYSRLQTESDRSFKILLSLLSSYWQSSIQGPNYTNELKAIAIEVSRLRLLLEDTQQDNDYRTTRTEYLYQVITSLLFSSSTGFPDLGLSDEDFRNFLLQVIKIFFAGSIPQSMQQAVELVTGGAVTVRENFIIAKQPGSGFDISDQFGFSIDIIMNSPNQFNEFMADKNSRLLLALMRPAHTLYKIKYILQDSYVGTQPLTANPPSDLRNTKILDQLKSALNNYSYEDFRRFFEGVNEIDKFGAQKPIRIIDETHIIPIPPS